MIGNLYENGLGVIKDEKKALDWYEKAGKAGYDKGQHNSGVFYYNRSVGHSNSYSYEMGMSYLTVMEVVV